jgi:hypothetical protein
MLAHFGFFREKQIPLRGMTDRKANAKAVRAVREFGRIEAF